MISVEDIKLFLEHQDEYIKFPPVLRTTKNVWGKEVILLSKDNNNYKTNKYELENWYIKVPYNEKYDKDAYLDIISKLITIEEYTHCSELGVPYYDITEYCLVPHWHILDNRTTNATITLVKYAKVLENIKEESEECL